VKETAMETEPRDPKAMARESRLEVHKLPVLK
jgi:hypothetical protein